MLTSRITRNADEKYMLDMIFSESITKCDCGRIMLPDGSWVWNEHPDYWTFVRMVDLFDICPDCMRKMMHAS